ncbi:MULTISPECIES: AAA-like domain-containing protein [Limnospira]|uniref:AAA-like domain-containing protein n=1 Tax=Limnospira TaxID=2596745 RepID=UPI0014497940|nr:AAA-like domain-containing protein [Limnospira indica]QJB28150.1 diguanylate cyclase [Limnospira fusiformis SAG 85.79]QNH58517.1 MAG: AAA-like domain-containing protein [Limnospira indica BM01]
MDQAIPPELEFSNPLGCLPCPDSPLSLDSAFYVERPPIEIIAYQQITQPGSVMRIKAPRKMGKSSLMLRLINHANSLGYSTVLIDFQQADLGIFESSTKFFRWLCSNVTRQLGIAYNINDYWDEDIGDKVSCTMYFEEYLIAQINRPFLLVFNEVNLLFEYPQIFMNFMPLLRFWHEKSAQSTIWQKLRLVLVHSTEVYVSLGINQSPFNVGVLIDLPEFTHQQVGELADKYQLTLTENQLHKLTCLVGGHPYLIHLAFHYLYEHQTKFDDFFHRASTDAGIYKNYLKKIWILIQKKPELVEMIQQLITAKTALKIEPISAYYLESIGIIKSLGNNYILAGDLYRVYFSYKPISPQVPSSIYIEQLERDNQYLSNLVYVDELTKVANRSQFQKAFKMEWECMAIKHNPLALIVCDIDYFKLYNDTFGHLAGDVCLQKIAQAIQQNLQRPNDLLARYGGEEFVVLLPQTDGKGAMFVAAKICLAVKELAIASGVPKSVDSQHPVVTISIGIASIIPSSDYHPETLFMAADQALYESKKAGRDRYTMSSEFNFKY